MIKNFDFTVFKVIRSLVFILKRQQVICATCAQGSETNRTTV